MARSVLGVSLLFIITLLLSGCGNMQPHIAVTSGNYAFGRGDFQRATIDYVSAGDGGTFGAYIQYNLGNVYYALGESGSAIQEWNGALDSEEEELLYRTHFNRGVLLFHLGQYEDAFSAFKQSLLVKPSSVDAKINLELSLARIGARSSARTETLSTETREEVERVMNYISRQEQPFSAPEGTKPQQKERDW